MKVCLQGCSLFVTGSASRKSIAFILQVSSASLILALSADAKRLTKNFKANLNARGC